MIVNYNVTYFIFQVMETKESVSTELDPNVPVEDVVIALNDSTVGEQVTNEAILQPTLVTISNVYY